MLLHFLEHYSTFTLADLVEPSHFGHVLVAPSIPRQHNVLLADERVSKRHMAVAQMYRIHIQEAPTL